MGKSNVMLSLVITAAAVQDNNTVITPISVTKNTLKSKTKNKVFLLTVEVLQRAEERFSAKLGDFLIKKYSLS